MIIGINSVLKKMSVALIKFIGYHSESREAKNIMATTFVTLFFNTGVVILLVSANYSYSVLSWIPYYGEYPDLT